MIKKTKKKGRGMGSPHLAGYLEGEGNRVLSYSRQSVYSMIKTKTSAKTCAAYRTPSPTSAKSKSYSAPPILYNPTFPPFPCFLL